MLNSKLEFLKGRFGVGKPEDWGDVQPNWILALDGFGPKTLDYLRLLLASRGLTLKGDRTPEYWMQHLEAERVDSLGDLDNGPDRGLLCPFTVLVDSAEQEPFRFTGIRGDAKHAGRPVVVHVETANLGRHPDSLGDYSLDFGIGRCHVERKSMEDAQGTILGWGEGGRRERFESELANLAKIEAGCVVVECSFADLVRLAPCYGRVSAATNAKTLYRSVLAFQQDYRTPWLFCDSRRMAELTTFRWLERWHRKDCEARKNDEQEATKLARKDSDERELAEL
jgi:hypothetical protein